MLFFSRKNTLELRLIDNQKVVVKCFGDKANFLNEKTAYDNAADCECISKLLWHDNDSVMHKQYIEGPTLLELLEELHSCNNLPQAKHYTILLCQLIKSYHQQTNMVIGDVSLSNFVVGNGRLYLVDLENSQHGAVASDYGQLLAFLSTYNPIGDSFWTYCCGVVRSCLSRDISQDVQECASQFLRVLSERRDKDYSHIDINQ